MGKKHIYTKPVFWISIAAAFLYCSWPLGFLLNPYVSYHALASQLEAPHQPFNWLFISLDVFTGMALVLSGIMQWRKKPKLNPTLRLSIVAYVFFGILVVAAALTPYNCNTIIQECYGLSHTPLFIIHGLSSIVSVALLGISLLLVIKSFIQNRIYNRWAMISLSLCVSWGMLGMGALISLKDRIDENWVQDILIAVCSLTIVLSVSLIEYLHERQSSATPVVVED